MTIGDWIKRAGIEGDYGGGFRSHGKVSLSDCDEVTDSAIA